MIKNLNEYKVKTTIYDPWAEPAEVEHEYKMNIVNDIPSEKFDAIVLTVAHQQFLNIDFTNLLTDNGIIYDVKGILTGKVDGRL